MSSDTIALFTLLNMNIWLGFCGVNLLFDTLDNDDDDVELKYATTTFLQEEDDDDVDFILK